MKTRMLINAVEAEEYRVAVVQDGVLEGFHIETSTAWQRIGNIYKGVVEKIQPSLQACFVDYGADRNGFLQASEIHPEYYVSAWSPEKGRANPPIEKVIQKGQELLVQVTREMPGKKGAHLTTYLSLAGRYVVITPGRTTGGVSRKIEDEEERTRLKDIMKELTLPEDVGYIVRTSALGQKKRELSRDLTRLLRMWENIKKQVKDAPSPSLIHKEQDMCLRTVRDYFTSDVAEVLVDDKDTYLKVKEYMKIISPWHQNRVKPYKGKEPIFDAYGVEKQIESIFKSEVPLKSGGSIVIDPTEALIAVDVNSGRARAKGVESTVYKTNLEAASEIARQLRLRDMGGLVVIDFIDMRDKAHIREVEKVVREEAKKDRAKIDMAHISKFGLLELSRERLRPSIESRSYQPCRYCQGRGTVQSVESASVSVLRQISMRISKGGIAAVKGFMAPEVETYLQNKKRLELAGLEERSGVEILLEADPSLAPGAERLEFREAVCEAPAETQNGPQNEPTPA
jgi:ribonuclease E